MNFRLFNIVDLLAVPLVLLLLIALLSRFKKKQPQEIQKYFFSAFFLRVIGTICIGVIIQYVYGYGDSFFYYYGAQALSGYLPRHPDVWLKLLFSNPGSNYSYSEELLQTIKDFDNYSFYVYRGTENANVSKIASVFNLVCFNSWTAIAMFFATCSFLGCWYIFKTFIHIFPGYEKQFSIICLYLPSLWFWGSGILKDPVCLFGLGILFYNFFVKRRSVLKRIVLIAFGSWILLSVKSYIFYAFAVAAFLGYILYLFKKSNAAGKIILTALFGFSLIAAFPLLSGMAENAVEDVITQSAFFIQSYSKAGVEGDASVIPVFDPTPVGFISLALKGLGTVYLRPFPWEMRKILYLFLILENMALYYIFFKKVKHGPIEFRQNAGFFSIFSFVFFIFLGMIIGVTTFNLGTIARYRVPGLPFLFGGFFCLKLLKRRKMAVKTNRRNFSTPEENGLITGQIST